MPESLAKGSRDDYQRFREIVGSDLDWPETFDEFEQKNAEHLAKRQAQGIVVETTIIDFDEFVAFCSDSGLQQDGVAFQAFAVSQNWGDPGAKRQAREVRSRARDFLDKRH